MCGRTGLSLDKNQVQCACSYKPKNATKFIKPPWIDEHNGGKEYTPSYNIAPTDVTPVIISASRFTEDNTNRIIKPMMWGIIPPWHKGDHRNHGLSTNNCRIENIKSSKLYGPALREGGRCVIVVEGFYEWQTTKPTKIKQPYYIYAQQDLDVDNPETWNYDFDEDSGWRGIKLLSLAGIYSVWKNSDVTIYCYSVITMDSNSTMNWLHHRMPAILESQEQVEAWLDIKNVNPEMALSYLRPVTILAWHPVSTDVNNSKNKSTSCNKRIKLITKKTNQKAITAWFTKAQKRKSDEGESDLKKIKKEGI
ncbi:Embryonic stem cell-specific 5-hydroxymethylcytosine-binding protein [Eumeta japonica]|uniref:Abasic site processing protein HMCES n=1 Tax=Eumeta variegata TaxID=151549 RepID=A0A4C1VM05_EUMVA|nr:Embryonic stem cell-specific 5-hydroxymethylcytosine-binding protein [Eumeta japonica]